MTAAFAHEYEVPDDDERLGELVTGATEGNVTYLVQHGQRLAAIVPIGDIGVRGDILRSRLFTNEQKQALLLLVDTFEKLNDANIAASQEWYWAPRWQSGEQEADAEVAAGSGRVFHSDDDLEQFLNDIPLPDAASGS